MAPFWHEVVGIDVEAAKVDQLAEGRPRSTNRFPKLLRRSPGLRPPPVPRRRRGGGGPGALRLRLHRAEGAQRLAGLPLRARRRPGGCWWSACPGRCPWGSTGAAASCCRSCRIARGCADRLPAAGRRSRASGPLLARPPHRRPVHSRWYRELCGLRHRAAGADQPRFHHASADGGDRHGDRCSLVLANENPVGANSWYIVDVVRAAAGSRCSSDGLGPWGASATCRTGRSSCGRGRPRPTGTGQRAARRRGGSPAGRPTPSHDCRRTSSGVGPSGFRAGRPDRRIADLLPRPAPAGQSSDIAPRMEGISSSHSASSAGATDRVTVRLSGS